MKMIRTRTAALVSIMITFLVGSGLAGRLRFIAVPQNRTVLLGETIVLPCQVLGGGPLEGLIAVWFMAEFAMDLSRGYSSSYPRFQIVGDSSRGDYSLQITNIQLEDNVGFRCQIEFIRTKEIFLDVQVVPKEAKILQGTVIEVDEKQNVSIKCVSEGGKPASIIRWFDDKRTDITFLSTLSVTPSISDRRLFDSKSELLLYPAKEDYGKLIICDCLNAAEKRPRKELSILLLVRHKPRTFLHIKSPSEGVIREGSDVVIECDVKAHPPEVNYVWENNGAVIENEDKSQLVLRNVTRILHDQKISCNATNSIGSSSASITLNIGYGPKFSSRPKSISALTGTHVNLTCAVSGNPLPKLEWVKEDADGTKDFVVIEENINEKITKSLLIKHIKSTHYGTYYCSASNELGLATKYIKLIPKSEEYLKRVWIYVACAAALTIITLLGILVIYCALSKNNKNKHNRNLTNGHEPELFEKELTIRLHEIDSLGNLMDESDLDLHSKSHVTTNVGLPLAGPVPLPVIQINSHHYELPKSLRKHSHYRYVDYSDEYAASSGHSGTADLAAYPSGRSMRGCHVRPDVIPMPLPLHGSRIDVRHAAVYGNTGLRDNGPGLLSLVALAKSSPPPYTNNTNCKFLVNEPPSPAPGTPPQPTPVASTSHCEHQPQVPKTSTTFYYKGKGKKTRGVNV